MSGEWLERCIGLQEESLSRQSLKGRYGTPVSFEKRGTETKECIHPSPKKSVPLLCRSRVTMEYHGRYGPKKVYVSEQLLHPTPHMNDQRQTKPIGNGTLCEKNFSLTGFLLLVPSVVKIESTFADRRDRPLSGKCCQDIERAPLPFDPERVNAIREDHPRLPLGNQRIVKIMDRRECRPRKNPLFRR